MPKQKTRKSVAKRFKKTGTGRFKHSSPGRSHLMSSKNGKRKRNLRAGDMVSKTEQKRLRPLMPY